MSSYGDSRAANRPGRNAQLHPQVWDISPFNPWSELNTSEIPSDDDDNNNNTKSHRNFFLIGMDQRFANRSSGTVQKGDGWQTFLGDQLAVLDELQIKTCQLLGSCIGSSYAFQLIQHSPRRFGNASCYSRLA